MVSASLILMISTGLVLFYLQAVSEKILRREFARPYFKAVVNAHCLEFSKLQTAGDENAPADYDRLRWSLKCDFITLTDLLKTSPRVGLCSSREERLLMLYSHLGFLSLSLRHMLKLRERPAVLKLASILHYLANVAGQRQLEFSLADSSPLSH
jgi:hypothetical protein